MDESKKRAKEKYKLTSKSNHPVEHKHLVGDYLDIYLSCKAF